MQQMLVTVIGKFVRALARLRGGGSALPGLVVERIDPSYVARTLSQLPQGVVLVSGTNGKTTTTKMVVELLESQGLRVFTNPSGSNFIRGVAASLLARMDWRGRLSADIAVVELDEAHAVHFVRTIKPEYTLLLNVMRDQLDRFGEIDTTARLLATVAQATAKKVVINREDPRLVALADTLPKGSYSFYGLDPTLAHLFPSDDDMRGQSRIQPSQSPSASCILVSLDNQTATVQIGNSEIKATVKLDGIYNVFNAVAAVAMVREIMGDSLNSEAIKQKLETITPAFGRGEILQVDSQPLELILVKNPGGFRLGLASFSAEGYATMIAINDNYADGRDMSWLWDVNFDSLSDTGVAMVSGVRAYDMALRLQYDDVATENVTEDLAKALRQFITHDHDLPKRIYCTYTAMLALRRELSKYTEVSEAL